MIDKYDYDYDDDCDDHDYIGLGHCWRWILPGQDASGNARQETPRGTSWSHRGEG